LSRSTDQARGVKLRKKLNGKRFGKTSKVLVDEAPDLEQLVNEVLFGRIWSRNTIDLRTRCVAVIAALTATGQRPQLKNYLANAINVGVTREEIVEILQQLVFYIGLPPVTNALEVAQEVFREENI
jgi:4-carboxymuconolactone decarboxylase